MLDKWEKACQAYVQAVTDGTSVGEVIDDYRLEYIRGVIRQTKHPQEVIDRVVAEIDDFLGSELGLMGATMMTASAQDIFVDYFTDGELVYIYSWGGCGFDVSWFPESLADRTIPQMSACAEMGMDEASTQEVVELLLAEGDLRPEDILPRLKAAIDKVASEAPEGDTSAAEMRPRAKLRLVKG